MLQKLHLRIYFYHILETRGLPTYWIAVLSLPLTHILSKTIHYQQAWSDTVSSGMAVMRHAITSQVRNNPDQALINAFIKVGLLAKVQKKPVEPKLRHQATQTRELFYGLCPLI
eukprot:7512282-Ditylum_brightwellii.AAC.1